MVVSKERIRKLKKKVKNVNARLKRRQKQVNKLRKKIKEEDRLCQELQLRLVRYFGSGKCPLFL